MSAIKKLPAFLVERYQTWRAQDYAAHQARYETLAREGQSPSVMVISCCDSRVYVADILHAQPGEFFIHRNIANLVPPYQPSGDLHGTSAAIEYGVCALHVKHLLVLGHAQCGGVQACHTQCAQGLTNAQMDYQFVAQWLGILRPAFDAIDTSLPIEEQLTAMAQQGIVNSLANLLTFPFVEAATQKGQLELHGAYHDIGRGVLSFYDPQTRQFVPA